MFGTVPTSNNVSNILPYHRDDPVGRKTCFIDASEPKSFGIISGDTHAQRPVEPPTIGTIYLSENHIKSTFQDLLCSLAMFSTVPTPKPPFAMPTAGLAVNPIGTIQLVGNHIKSTFQVLLSRLASFFCRYPRSTTRPLESKTIGLAVHPNDTIQLVRNHFN